MAKLPTFVVSGVVASGAPLPVTTSAILANISSFAAGNLRSVTTTTQDEAAFCELREAYGSSLFNMMMRSGADAGTAAQLAEEALTTVWREVGRSQPDKASPTIIFKVARNLRITRLREEFNWHDVSGKMMRSVPDDIPHIDPLAASERQSRIHALLKDLGAEQRQVVELAYLEGLSHGQIAYRLSIPVGSVKASMRSIYMKVRGALEDLK
jgi:RNA polymerase sigma-70 factor, ECF subfamily